MEKKKLYWLIESNCDLSNTCGDTETCLILLQGDFDDLALDWQKEIQYTITPVWYTDEEYAALPED